MPIITVATQIFLYFTIIIPPVVGMLSQVGGYSITCGIGAIRLCLFVTATTIYVLRAYILLFRLKLAHEYVNMYENTNVRPMITRLSTAPSTVEIEMNSDVKTNISQDSSPLKSSDFYLKYAYLISRKFLFLIGGVPIVTIWTLGIVDFGIQIRNQIYFPDCNIPLSRFTFLSIEISKLFVIVFITFKLRFLSDAFGIKREFLVTSASGILSLLVYLIVNVFNDDHKVAFLTGMWIFMLFGCVSLFATVWRPIISSFNKHWKEENSETSISNPSGKAHRITRKEFQGLLDNSEWFTAFKNYLITEMSVENLLFWKYASSLLREKFSNVRKYELPGLRRRISFLMENYLLDTAKLQVNISSKVHEYILKVWDNILNLPDDCDESSLQLAINPFPEALESCISETLQLMYSDSFRRFQITSSYRSLIEKRLVLNSFSQAGNI